jgi:hypothetical protein
MPIAIRVRRNVGGPPPHRRLGGLGLRAKPASALCERKSCWVEHTHTQHARARDTYLYTMHSQSVKPPQTILLLLTPISLLFLPLLLRQKFFFNPFLDLAVLSLYPLPYTPTPLSPFSFPFLSYLLVVE